MKILFLTANITTVGGIERVISILANHFVTDLGYEVQISSVYDYNGNVLPAFSVDERVKLKFHKMTIKTPKSVVEKLMQNFNQYRKIKKIVEEEKYDCIITTHPHISVPVLLCKKQLKGSCIITEHADYENCTNFWKLLRKLTYIKSDKVVVLTEANKQKYHFLTSDEIQVIPNPLSFTVENKKREKSKKIIAVGRLEYEKGFDRLIDIFSSIASECSEWSLDIIGDGSQKEFLINKINEKNLNQKIKIKPFTTEIVNNYLSASICAIPSRNEAFSMVLLEAMSCGLACISYNLPGPSEIINNGVDGTLIYDNDNESFSKELLKLIKDDNLRNHYSINSLHKVSRYSIECIINDWKQLFETLKIK